MQEVLNNSGNNGHSLPPNQRKPKEYVINSEELKDLIFNATSRDTRALRQLLQEKRDYDNECDYPRELTVDKHYKFYFDYHAVATRTVEVLPLETWQVQPAVFEDDDPNVKTEFEKAWDELGSNLRGQSWHKREEGSPVWEYLKRADILSGIGSFGVILLGFDDGQPLNTPVAMLAEEDDNEESDSWDTTEESDMEGSTEDNKDVTTNATGSIDSQYDGSVFGTDKVPKLKEGTKRKLIFMRPFDETLVQVTRLETDINSPRHNQPVMYRLTLIDPDFAKEHAISMDISCPEVHWTRILHIADNLTNSECFGVPRQQPVYRHLRNLYKLYGGAPEMYWRGAMNGVSWETHPQLGGEVDVDKSAMRDEIENFRNGLQRDAITTGFTAKSIAPNVADATPFIDSQITAICIKIGCPQRIFMGSERGELASSQDDSSWNDRLKHRQQMYVTPRIIIPFIDRMIATGVLPKPQGKIVEENLTEDDGQDQEVIDEESSLQEKETGKPTANAFGKPSSIDSKGGLGGKTGFSPSSKGNASKAMSSPGGDNVGTGQEVAPAAPKQRQLPEMNSKPGYTIVWPDLDSMTEAQKATIFLQKTQALMAFIAGNGESAMTLMDFYTKYGSMTDEEAIGVITAVNTQIEKDERLTPDPEEARQDEMDMQGEQFDKELEAKKELAEQGHGFGLEMQDKQQGFAEKMAKLKPAGKPVANFNPNQPRDSDGKFRKGGGAEGNIYYHGTTVRNVNSILKTGLLVSKSHSYKSKQIMLREQGGHTYFGTNIEGTGDRGAVLHVVTKPEHNIHNDPIDYRAVRTKVDISPEHITHVSIKTGEQQVRYVAEGNETRPWKEGDTQKGWLVKQPAYTTYTVDEYKALQLAAKKGKKSTHNLSALEKAQRLVQNFNPSQPRDAQGRWSQGQSNFASASEFPAAGAGGLPLSHGGINDLMDPAYVAYVEGAAKRGVKLGQGVLSKEQRQDMEKIAGDDRFKLTTSETFYFSLGSNDKLKTQLESGEVKFNGTRSMSLDTSRKSYGDTHFEVQAKPGQRVVLAEAFGLPEAVLLPGSKMKVTGTKKRGNDTVHLMEIIDDGTEPTKNILRFLDKVDPLPTLNYNPSQKRDNRGRWSGGGAVKTTAKGEELHAVTRNPETKQWLGANGTPAPEHIQKLGIPPGWNNVHVNPDPDGTMLARGVDSKGRPVYKYSANDQAKNAAAKFGRVSELRKKREGIFNELANDAKNPEHKENAECLKVIMQTGMRPGSNKDTKADHQSYGATTLQGRHVKVAEDGSVSLKFATGKNKGREVEFPIGDPSTASMLINRAMVSGAEGNLFKTDASVLRDYSKGKDGGGFKTKDHRTALGTETAIREIQKRPIPKNMTEYKAATKEVATVVAKTLGNTPAIALKSYIDPTVFGSWKPAN